MTRLLICLWDSLIPNLPTAMRLTSQARSILVRGMGGKPLSPGSLNLNLCAISNAQAKQSPGALPKQAWFFCPHVAPEEFLHIPPHKQW